MDEEKAREIRRDLRGIASEHNIGGMNKDFFAEFMRRRFKDSIENKIERDDPYVHEWAERFGRGEQWHRADEESEAILLDILLEGPSDITAAFITSEGVRDAIDKEKLERLI